MSERKAWQAVALMVFAPWVHDEFFSLGERLFVCAVVWAIVVFQMVLPIVLLT